MSDLYRAFYHSPIGWIVLSGTGQALCTLDFCPEAKPEAEAGPYLPACLEQLHAYFQGQRRTFDLALAPQGTPFQQSVWQAVRQVAFGQLRSYQQIAADLGKPGAARAVGAANGRNPMAIIIPCHRIVGRHGALTGYGGGLWRKEWLLRHEGSLLL